MIVLSQFSPDSVSERSSKVLVNNLIKLEGVYKNVPFLGNPIYSAFCVLFRVLSEIVISTAVTDYSVLTLGSCKCSALAYSLSCSLYSFLCFTMFMYYIICL